MGFCHKTAGASPGNHKRFQSLIVKDFVSEVEVTRVKEVEIAVARIVAPRLRSIGTML